MNGIIYLVGLVASFIWLPLLKAEDPLPAKNPPPNEPIIKEEIKVSQVEYFNRFASRFLAIGDLEKAQTFVKSALELEPKNQASHIIKTNILVNSEKFEEARESAKMAFPNSPYEQLFYLADKGLDVVPASINLRKQTLSWAIEAQTINKNWDKWLGLVLSNAYFRNNNIDKAIEIAKPFIEREPKNWKLNILLGNIYTKKGDYEVAIKYLSKGMNREPLNALCFNHLSYQLLTYDDEIENRPIIALSYAILASDLSKQKVPDIEDTLALAYFKTNDLTSAVAAQNRAVILLRDELPKEQRERSTKLMGFKKQLLKYETVLKNVPK